MPYVAPSTVVAGQTYSAAAHNVIVNDVIDHESRIVTATNQSVQVFTNEAARDAAITSPSEGMHAYLTAPTVPAATGGTTYIPTGITTVYNGTSWVCVTPVGAFTSPIGTTTSTSFTATLSGSPGTNPTVTLTTGTTALIHLGATVESNNTGNTVVGFAVSGATTLAADDARSIGMNNHTANAPHYIGQSILVGGLTAGTNTFTMQYKVSLGTLSVYFRRITVVGLP
jgi:hypothetical protein